MYNTELVSGQPWLQITDPLMQYFAKFKAVKVEVEFFSQYINNKGVLASHLVV